MQSRREGDLRKQMSTTADLGCDLGPGRLGPRQHSLHTRTHSLRVWILRVGCGQTLSYIINAQGAAAYTSLPFFVFRKTNGDVSW